MSTSRTYELNPKQMLTVSETLKVTHGFTEKPLSNPYQSWVLKSDPLGTAISYTSGKLVLQGGDITRLEEIVNKLVSLDASSKIDGADRKDVQRANNFGAFRPHIGVDEVGKGDYFGPMVAVAAYVQEADLDLLQSNGVGDSKKINDSKIIQIHNEIVDRIEHCVYIMEPIEYNSVYKKIGNVAVVLARLHAGVIEGLLTELEASNLICEEIVIDQFSKSKHRSLNELGPKAKKLPIKQFHKGESDIAVATASILARAYFLDARTDMEAMWDMKFPKGASNVIPTGKKFVSRYSVDDLQKVAKVSFKTTKQVLA